MSTHISVCESLVRRDAVEEEKRHHDVGDDQPDICAADELESPVGLCRLAEHAKLDGEQYRPDRHQHVGNLESESPRDVARGQDGDVADDVQHKADVHDGEDKRLAILRRALQTIHQRNKSLADSGNDQRGEAEQLHVTQRPVDQRDAADDLLLSNRSRLGEEEEIAQQGLQKEPQE